MANVKTRSIPLSSLITPATLGVDLRPNPTLRTASVYKPRINSFDYDTNKVYSPRSGQPTKLSQMFTVIAGTGELSRISAPDSLQNISYTIDLTVPLVRCDISDETVRSLTATAAYNQAIAGLGRIIDTNSSIFHAENLTFTASMSDSSFMQSEKPLQGQIGYYAMLGDRTVMANELELWIAIANPPIGAKIFDYPAPYSASYYTCALRNASVTTEIDFVDNVQSLQATDIQVTRLSQSDNMTIRGNDSSGDYAIENYHSYGYLLYNLLSGFVMNEGAEKSHYGWNWTTTLDQTIFGTASDFSVMMDAWKDGGVEEDSATKEKNLITMIEEFSLNASWSLMSMPRYR